MMKHELEKQLDALEKKGVDRRHFFKLLAATGLIVELILKSKRFF